MGFQNPKQRTKVCHLLLEMGGFHRFCNKQTFQFSSSDVFDEDFEKEAIRVKRKESSLSSGEQVLLMVVADFWNGSGLVKITDIMSRLDTGIASAIGALMVACIHPNPIHIDAWLEQWDGYDPKGDYFSR